MITDAFTLYKKVAILFFLTFLFHQTSYSQCTNPDPTGSASQDFCVSVIPDVGDLSASGGTIAWYDVATGGSQLNPSAPLIDGDVYYADDIDGGGCSPNRLAVTANLYGDYPSDMDVFVGKCASTDPTIADLKATGTDIKWFDAETGGTELSLSDPLSDGSVYWAQQTENGCTSLRFPTVVTIVDPPPPTVDPIQSFCSPPNLTIADLNGVGSNILWYDTDTSTTPLDPTTPLVHGEDYWGAQSSVAFPCESTVRAQTTVQIDQMPIAGTNGSYAVCEIDAVTTNLFSLLAGAPETTGTWTGPSTLTGGHLGTYDPAVNTIGDYVYTVNSALGVCVPATATVSVVITVIPPPTVVDTAQAFCEIDGATVASLVATGTSLLWYDTETDTTPLATTDLLVDGEDYWASQTEATSGCQSAARVVVNVTIMMPPPPTATEVNQSFCEIDGATVAELVATGASLNWYDTETSTTPLALTDVLINGEDYWASDTDATSGCESATRLVVNVAILMPVPPTTTEVNQAFCEIDNPTVANLDATGTGIQWYDTDTSNTPIDPSTALIDGEDYWATQIDGPSGCESITRLVVNVTINQPLPPTTTETTQTFCEIDGSMVSDLTATGNAIAWYDTETDTTPLLPTESLIDGEDYWASQTDITSGCESASRIVVTASILTPPPPTTTESNQAFCEIDGATVAELVATGTSIVWYDTELSTTPLALTDALINGEDYWAADTEPTIGCESVTRIVINVTINTPQPPTTSNPVQSFCEIQGATVAELSATGTGLLWYDTETSTTALNNTDILIDGEDYWASQTDATSACESISRLVVTVSLTIPPPPTTTESNQSFCEIDGATVANLMATGNNLMWYNTETDTTPLNATDALIDGEDYWASQTDAPSGCESVSRLVVNVTIITIPPPTTTEVNQAFCLNDFLPGAPTIADITATGTDITWYATETDTTPLLSTDNLIDGEDYWASETDATSGCVSASRLVVNISIVDLQEPTTTNPNQSFCSVVGGTVADLQATGTNILWYDTDISTTSLDPSETLVDGQDYWATQSDDLLGCESLNRLEVTVSIIDVAPPTVSNPTQSFCASDAPTISDITITANNAVWYDSETATSPLSSSELLVNGMDYWAADSDSGIGCESSVRIVVSITLTDPGTPTLSSLGNEFCKIENPTLADLNDNVSPANGGTITWYDDYPNGSEVFLSDALEEGATYYAIESDSSNCDSTTPLQVTVTLEACDEYDITVYDGFSPSGDGKNDTFKITNLRALYPNFKTEFFNRWGSTVYTGDANKPDWDGRLNGNGELAPAGVYYVVIHFNEDNRQPIQKRLYLSR